MDEHPEPPVAAQGERPTWGIGAWLFLRALGFVSLAAFVSLWVQVHGLVGARGILPLAPWLDAVRERMGGAPWADAPTLFWLGASDRALDLACGAGVACSLLLVAGLAQPLAIAGAWACYLSLTVACRDFLTFQWDLLLLECLLLALFLAPLALAARRPHEPPAIARWLLWWLLFRLMFMSGVVKLTSGDPSWRDLTAMRYHHETQPIPAPLAWYLHHLPLWVHRATTFATFVVELALPFLILGPRRARRAAALAFIGLQAFISLSGNYGFFNLLTAALCLLLLDDAAFPQRLRSRLTPPAEARPPRRWPPWLLAPAAGVVLLVTCVHACDRFDLAVPWPRPVTVAVQALAPFRSLNGYGLFAVMTKMRPQVVIQGSDDGVVWHEYQLPHWPGDPRRRPEYFQPHMPRLDWRLWFASLGSFRQSPWFAGVARGLLEGSPDVLALFATNPFPDRPPRYIRARLYDYHFSLPEERARTGFWWMRRDQGDWLPAVSLESFRPR